MNHTSVSFCIGHIGGLLLPGEHPAKDPGRFRPRIIGMKVKEVDPPIVIKTELFPSGSVNPDYLSVKVEGKDHLGHGVEKG